MKSSRIPIPLLLVLLTVLAGCASGAGTQSGGGSGVLDLADLLTGRWQAEGSDLTLDITTAGENTSGQVFNLFASTTGRLGERSVSERAVLHLEWEGGRHPATFQRLRRRRPAAFGVPEGGGLKRGLILLLECFHGSASSTGPRPGRLPDAAGEARGAPGLGGRDHRVAEWTRRGALDLSGDSAVATETSYQKGSK